MLETRFDLAAYERMVRDAKRLVSRYDFVELGLKGEHDTYLRVRQNGTIWGFALGDGNLEDIDIVERDHITVFGRRCKVRPSPEGGYIFSEAR